MSAFRQRLIVRRDSRDEETFAVIEWNGVHPSELLAALRRALTEWRKTPEGRAAWEASGHDFNIGDLSGEHCQRGTGQDAGPRRRLSPRGRAPSRRIRVDA